MLVTLTGHKFKLSWRWGRRSLIYMLLSVILRNSVSCKCEIFDWRVLVDLFLNKPLCRVTNSTLRNWRMHVHRVNNDIFGLNFDRWFFLQEAEMAFRVVAMLRQICSIPEGLWSKKRSAFVCDEAMRCSADIMGYQKGEAKKYETNIWACVCPYRSSTRRGAGTSHLFLINNPVRERHVSVNRIVGEMTPAGSLQTMPSQVLLWWNNRRKVTATEIVFIGVNI
jgi:hypothetical protein